ncbi:MAG: hypothetical protein AABX33_02160 [Nanoarchaeota archaeon]
MRIITIVFLATVLLLVGCKQVLEDPLFKDCLELKNDMGNCVEKKIAELPRDFDCETIKNEEAKAYCYGYFAKANKDDKLCSNIKGKYQALCLMELSEVSTSDKICDELDNNDKTNCLSNVYTNLAVETNSPSPCYNLESDFRYKCITTMAIILRNQSLCSDIDKERAEQDYILTGSRIPRYVCQEWVVGQVAIDGNDVSVCNEFEFKGNKYLDAKVPKGKCVDVAAQCNKNEKLCEAHDNEEYKESCKNSVSGVQPLRESGPSDKAEDNKGLICNLWENI